MIGLLMCLLERLFGPQLPWLVEPHRRPAVPPQRPGRCGVAAIRRAARKRRRAMRA